MEITVKRERNVQTLHTFIPVPDTIKAFVSVPDGGLDLEGCVLAAEDSEEDQELKRLEAIRLRDTLALGQSHEDVSPGGSDQPGKRRYRNETEEGRRARLARDAERRRQSRKMESEQDAVTRRTKQAAARRYYLQYLETEEEAQRRRKQNAEHKRNRRQMMSAEEREEVKRRESARRAEKRKEMQEQKRVPQSSESATEYTIKREPLPDILAGQLPVDVVPPQMQIPIEMQPILSQMGFPAGLAPFQMNPNRSSYGGYSGY